MRARRRAGQAVTEYVLMLAILTGIALYLVYILASPQGSVQQAQDAAVKTIPND